MKRKSLTIQELDEIDEHPLYLSTSAPRDEMEVPSILRMEFSIKFYCPHCFKKHWSTIVFRDFCGVCEIVCGSAPRDENEWDKGCGKVISVAWNINLNLKVSKPVQLRQSYKRKRLKAQSE